MQQFARVCRGAPGKVEKEVNGVLAQAGVRVVSVTHLPAPDPAEGGPVHTVLVIFEAPAGDGSWSAERDGRKPGEAT